LARIAAGLRKARDASGRALDLIEVPTPPAHEVMAAPRSYTSILPVNGGLVIPAFDAPTDDEAAAALARAFPDRVVRQVPAAVLGEAGLTLPSLVIPQPARLLERNRATILPRSAHAQPVPDIDAILQKYIDLASKN
jgi:agmatine deiminase